MFQALFWYIEISFEQLYLSLSLSCALSQYSTLFLQEPQRKSIDCQFTSFRVQLICVHFNQIAYIFNRIPFDSQSILSTSIRIVLLQLL